MPSPDQPSKRNNTGTKDTGRKVLFHYNTLGSPTIKTNNLKVKTRNFGTKKEHKMTILDFVKIPKDGHHLGDIPKYSMMYENDALSSLGLILDTDKDGRSRF